MSVCVKIVIKSEIDFFFQKIVIFFFCPYRTALVKTQAELNNSKRYTRYLTLPRQDTRVSL